MNRAPMRMVVCGEDIAHRMATWLDAVWIQHDPPEAGHDPAYRAATALLLGVGMRERFGDAALVVDILCGGVDWNGTSTAAVLDPWLERVQACLGQAGFHPMEALYTVCSEHFAWLEKHPELRTIDDRPCSCLAWAAGAIGLPLGGGRDHLLCPLRTACIDQAQAVHDWFSVGLACLDTWLADDGTDGFPEACDVMSVVLATGYLDTPVERRIICKLLDQLIGSGIGNAWRGRLDAVSLTAFNSGRIFAQQDVAACRLLFGEVEADLHRAEVGGIEVMHAVFRTCFGSSNHRVWHAGIASAVRAYIKTTIRAHYLPNAYLAPAVLRDAVDYAFWAGVLSCRSWPHANQQDAE
jgi:hypothetical protein